MNTNQTNPSPVDTMLFSNNPEQVAMALHDYFADRATRAAARRARLAALRARGSEFTRPKRRATGLNVGAHHTPRIV